MAVRDFAKEKLALKQYQGIYKKSPTSSDDWNNLHSLAYPGGLPDEFKKASNEALAASGLTKPVAPLGQTVATSDLAGLKAKSDAAYTEADKLGKPNEALRVLQEAIRTKSGIGEQPLGTSDVFKQAGLTGMGSLNASLAETNNKFVDDMSTFKNIIGQMSGTYKDAADSALARYTKSYTSYKDEVDRLQGIQDDLSSRAHEISLIHNKSQADKDFELWKRANPSSDDIIKAEEAGLVFTPGQGYGKEVPIQTPTNSRIGDGVVTGYGSKYWGAGLDFVISGGEKAPVRSPFIGEVIAAGNNGDFGNQVKVRTSSGEEVWLSHLNSINVKVGQQINEETIIGGQGKTGKVYGKNSTKRRVQFFLQK